MISDGFDDGINMRKARRDDGRTPVVGGIFINEGNNDDIIANMPFAIDLLTIGIVPGEHGTNVKHNVVATMLSV